MFYPEDYWMEYSSVASFKFTNLVLCWVVSYVYLVYVIMMLEYNSNLVMYVDIFFVIVMSMNSSWLWPT